MPIRPVILIVLDLLRYTNSISVVLPPLNSATIYGGGLLTEKIITRECDEQRPVQMFKPFVELKKG